MIQFVPHREHDVLISARPLGEGSVRAMDSRYPFVVTITQDTEFHCVGKPQNF